MKKLFCLGLLLASLAGCTVKNAHIYPQHVRDKYLITTGDIDQPYESLGLIQITKVGVTFFGFIDILDANLQGMFQEALLIELEKAGADGIINMHFHEVQHTTATRIFFLFLPFIPLPNSVEVTGELIKFKTAES